MSFIKGLKEWWDSLRGKGPAAAVALTLDLGEARDNVGFSLEAGGLVVERCDGDLYARINGPNGDAINLYYVKKVMYPFSAVFLTNTAQTGKSARLLLLPPGMDADPIDTFHFVPKRQPTIDFQQVNPAAGSWYTALDDVNVRLLSVTEIVQWVSQSTGMSCRITEDGVARPATQINPANNTPYCVRQNPVGNLTFTTTLDTNFPVPLAEARTVKVEVMSIDGYPTVTLLRCNIMWAKWT